MKKVLKPRGLFSSPVSKFEMTRRLKTFVCFKNFRAHDAASLARYGANEVPT